MPTGALPRPPSSGAVSWPQAPSQPNVLVGPGSAWWGDTCQPRAPVPGGARASRTLCVLQLPLLAQLLRPSHCPGICLPRGHHPAGLPESQHANPRVSKPPGEPGVRLWPGICPPSHFRCPAIAYAGRSRATGWVASLSAAAGNSWEVGGLGQRHSPPESPRQHFSARTSQQMSGDPRGLSASTNRVLWFCSVLRAY